LRAFATPSCDPLIATRFDVVRKGPQPSGGPATQRSSPPPGGGCGLLRFLAEPQYNDRVAACGAHAKFGYELRASATPRLRPARSYGPIPTRDKPAAEWTGLFSSNARMQSSAGGGCGLRRFPAEPQYNDRAAACGGRARLLRSCGPPPPPGCGPPIASRSKKRKIGIGLRLAKRPRTSGRKGGRELRAFTERSCGPLRFLTGTAHEE